MNDEQISSLFRIALNSIGSVLAAYGYIDAEAWALISGPLLVVLVAVWGVWRRRNVALVESAAAVPGVVKIVAPELAPVTASDKVREQ